MPSTLYDKLGDLLSRTLDEGQVPFVHAPHAESSEAASKSMGTNAEPSTASTDSKRSDAESANAEPHASAKHTGGGQGGTDTGTADEFARFRGKRRSSFTIYKYVPPEVARCYQMLGVPHGASQKDIKAAYKARLKALHPDHFAADSAEQAAATEQTALLVQAYQTVIAFAKKA